MGNDSASLLNSLLKNLARHAGPVDFERTDEQMDAVREPIREWYRGIDDTPEGIEARKKIEHLAKINQWSLDD